MAGQSPIVSLEEADTPPITLSSLLLDHYDLLLEILNALLCDYGLSGLAGSCKSLRLLLTRPQKKYGCTEAASLYDERVAELVDLQGWRSRPLTITSRLASRPRNNAPRTYERRLPVPHPPGYKKYSRRLRSLPPPHAPWVLDAGGRTLTVGTGKNSWATYATVRDAVAAAVDGDTILLLEGIFDEGLEPIVLSKSVRIMGSSRGPGVPPPSLASPPNSPVVVTTSRTGSPNRRPGGEETHRPEVSTLRAILVASDGHGSINGLTLGLPHEATEIHNQADANQNNPVAFAALLAEPENGDGDNPDDPQNGPLRCLAVTRVARWAIEDCRIVGGLRAGSRSELAVIGCHLSRDPRSMGLPASTGVLVQGSARCLVRACVVDGFERSGVTCQHAAELWCDHSCVAGNALTGIKCTSRASCVVTHSSLLRNGHFGMLIRDRARASLLACEISDNSSVGIACISKAATRLRGCEISGNEGFGLVCQHEGRTFVEQCRVEKNGGAGVMVAQEAEVTCIKCSLLSSHSADGGAAFTVQARASLKLGGGENYVETNTVHAQMAAEWGARHGNGEAPNGHGHAVDLAQSFFTRPPPPPPFNAEQEIVAAVNIAGGPQNLAAADVAAVSPQRQVEVGFPVGDELNSASEFGAEAFRSGGPQLRGSVAADGKENNRNSGSGDGASSSGSYGSGAGEMEVGPRGTLAKKLATRLDRWHPAFREQPENPGFWREGVLRIVH